MSDKIKILYIDDEPINVQLFKINFSKKFDVITGYSGFEGMDLLSDNPETKIIISDMKMPGMNGIEFIQKAKEKYPVKKYFIHTGYDVNEEIQKAIDSGLIQKYFRKPFNMSEIANSINEALGNMD